MMSKLDVQRGYILRQKPFSETSAILDCFLEHDGRISIMAKGVRRRSRQTQAQLFTEYWLSYGGKSELKQLRQFDYTELQHPLSGMALTCGFYLNELLLYLTEKEEAMPALWTRYQSAIQQFRQTKQFEPILREFEYALVTELGYGFHLNETSQGEPLIPSQSYVFEFSYGLEVHHLQAVTSNQLILTGKELLAIQAQDWTQASTLLSAKHLFRKVIAHLLDGRSLKSRAMAKVERK